MNMLQVIADNLSEKILVEKSIRDFENILPKILERGLTEDEWFELYRIVDLCDRCMKIVAGNLGRFSFSESFFRLRILNKETHREFFMKEFLDERDFVEIKKFLELNLDEVKEWDNSIKSYGLREAKHCLFVRIVLDFTKDDLKDKKFKKFLISYIEKNKDLKGYLHEKLNGKLGELSLKKTTILQIIIEYGVKILIFLLVTSALILGSFILVLGVPTQLSALVYAIALVLGLVAAIITIYSFLISRLRKKRKGEKDD